jgi:hypothetical protein
MSGRAAGLACAVALAFGFLTGCGHSLPVSSGSTNSQNGDQRRGSSDAHSTYGERETSEPVMPVDFQPGDVLDGFGGLKWRVLAVEEGRALIMTKEVVARRAYHDRREDVTWEECTLRQWLNGEFLDDHFSGAEQAVIVETDLANPDGNGYIGDYQFTTIGGSGTQDKIFLLSVGEARNYSVDDDARRAKWAMTENQVEEDARHMNDNDPDKDYSEILGFVRENSVGPASWWLRTPGQYSSYAARVSSAGSVEVDGYSVNDAIGVRPAMWVSGGIATLVSLEEAVDLTDPAEVIVFAERAGECAKGKYVGSIRKWTTVTNEPGSDYLEYVYSCVDAEGGSKFVTYDLRDLELGLIQYPMVWRDRNPLDGLTLQPDGTYTYEK